MNGYLAYLDEKPVGWCNVNSKENYAKIPFKEKSKDKIVSLICFIIAPSYRKQGIARNMLKYACSTSQEGGYDIFEAYPRKGETLSDAHSYHGPVSLFDSEGFIVVNEDEHFLLMRKSLN